MVVDLDLEDRIGRIDKQVYRIDKQANKAKALPVIRALYSLFFGFLFRFEYITHLEIEKKNKNRVQISDENKY